MDDYSDVGRAKLEQQAGNTLDFIRCPLDSAAMLVTKSIASRYVRGETSYREFEGLPGSAEWKVSSLYLQCSACGRRADDIPVNSAAQEVFARR